MKRLPPDLETTVGINIIVCPNETGMRFDQVVSSRLAGCSRDYASQMIKIEQIKLNGIIKKSGYRLQPGDHITGTILIPVDPALYEIQPEAVDLDILHEDSSLIVINKPPGLVVHPAPGHWNGTLVHGLLYHYPETENVGTPGRPGIVHRIDKDTSGVLIVARTAEMHAYLTALFKSRQIKKAYIAVAYGNPRESNGVITHPISRHKKNRKKMTASQDPENGREAYTSWEIMERFNGLCLLRLGIKTGRTHQIRVHCAAMGHPLVGDGVYGYKNPFRGFVFSPAVVQVLKTINRQMLHSHKITFKHPETDTETSFESPLPPDMSLLHQVLKES